MCRTLEQGGRRCAKHRKQWEKLTEQERESILRMQEDLLREKMRTERVNVRITHQQQSWLLGQNLNSAELRARVVGKPFRTERTLAQHLAASEAEAVAASEAQGGGRVPTAGHAAAVRYNVNLTKEEDAAVQVEAAHYGLPKAEYARRQLVEEDVRRHPISMGKDTRRVREAWLSIPDDSRRGLVQQRVGAEQQIAQCKERMRELERVIIMKRGTGDEKDYEAVGAAMREKALLKLSLEELQEQHARELQQQREATARREQSIQKLRAALSLSMQAMRLVKGKRHTEAFILGFGAAVVGAAARRANRPA